jgi:O-acetyl-ADP-ribose deacetylase (regulator of RNase III)
VVHLLLSLKWTRGKIYIFSYTILLKENNMIYEVTGDILLSESEVIAHGVAPEDNFTNGLALSLREQWPAMVKDFRHYCQVSHPKPGEVWVWGGPGGKRIVNLMIQAPATHHGGHPGRATTVNVNHVLRELRKLIESEGYPRVALPRLATGVGGLSWGEVQPLIQQHLGDLSIPIYVYTEFHKGMKADETGK